MKQQINNMKEYQDVFPVEIRKEAVKNILDIRKFEIDLYWKRAAYFWTFTGAVMAGYITVINTSDKPKGQFILIILGMIFSLCWYFVNRGGKYWQLNWEKHLDIMEDKLIGPLYKTTISRDHYTGKWTVFGPFPFSVSKINIILSFLIFLLWAIIYSNFMWSNKELFLSDGWNFFRILNIFVPTAILLLLVSGRTGKGRNDKFQTHIFFDKRSFSEENPSKSTDDTNN